MDSDYVKCEYHRYNGVGKDHIHFLYVQVQYLITYEMSYFE